MHSRRRRASVNATSLSAPCRQARMPKPTLRRRAPVADDDGDITLDDDGAVRRWHAKSLKLCDKRHHRSAEGLRQFHALFSRRIYSLAYYRASRYFASSTAMNTSRRRAAYILLKMAVVERDIDAPFAMPQATKLMLPHSTCRRVPAVVDTCQPQ